MPVFSNPIRKEAGKYGRSRGGRLSSHTVRGGRGRRAMDFVVCFGCGGNS